MNHVILMGRLTRDPEIRYTQGDNSMCIARYTLAIDRRFSRGNDGDGNSADFIPCVVFGKGGEFAEKYLKKGTKIAVTGRIQTGSYTNKDGVKVFTTEVVVEDQEFAESRNSQGGGNSNYGGGYGQGQGGYGQNGGGGYNGSYGQNNSGRSGNGGNAGNSYGPQNSAGSYGQAQRPNAQNSGPQGGTGYGGGGAPRNNSGRTGGSAGGGRSGAQNDSRQGGGYGNNGAPRGGGQQAQHDDLDGFMNIPDGIDEELPFT